MIKKVCSSSVNPFVEYSSFTFAMDPTFVQVMLCVELIAQASAPLGAATVKEPLILKLVLEVSKASALVVSETFTRTPLEMLSGIVQA